MNFDLNALTRQWQNHWPECSPEGEKLRICYPDRWVRFHSLPNSKRYPDSDAEINIMLDRYNTIFRDLHAGSEVTVIVSQWTEGRETASRVQLEGSQYAIFWQSVNDNASDDSSHDSTRRLYVAKYVWSPGVLNALLQLVAEDEMSGVIIAPDDLHWLTHPYDGGIDIILPTEAKRNELKERHPDWLSSDPDGL